MCVCVYVRVLSVGQHGYGTLGREKNQMKKNRGIFAMSHSAMGIMLEFRDNSPIVVLVNALATSRAFCASGQDFRLFSMVRVPLFAG